MDNPILMSAAAYDGYDLCGEACFQFKKGVDFPHRCGKDSGGFSYVPGGFCVK
jgi:hypothetical protein